MNGSTQLLQPRAGGEYDHMPVMDVRVKDKDTIYLVDSRATHDVPGVRARQIYEKELRNLLEESTIHIAYSSEAVTDGDRVRLAA